MNNAHHLKLYGWYAPRCERLFGWLSARPQRRAVALLGVQPGERVFVPGVGTGTGLTLALVLGHGIVLLRTSAELVAERGNPKEMRKWDKVVSLLWLVLSYLALPLKGK